MFGQCSLLRCSRDEQNAMDFSCFSPELVTGCISSFDCVALYKCSLSTVIKYLESWKTRTGLLMTLGAYWLVSCVLACRFWLTADLSRLFIWFTFLARYIPRVLPTNNWAITLLNLQPGADSIDHWRDSYGIPIPSPVNSTQHMYVDNWAVNAQKT